MVMKLLREDNGNCRVYYRAAVTKDLFCYQNEGRDGWHFYRCSKDGEPSYRVSVPDNLPWPDGETATGCELRRWLEWQTKYWVNAYFHIRAGAPKTGAPVEVLLAYFVMAIEVVGEN